MAVRSPPLISRLSEIPIGVRQFFGARTAGSSIVLCAAPSALCWTASRLHGRFGGVEVAVLADAGGGIEWARGYRTVGA
jgi:hypothetical protein